MSTSDRYAYLDTSAFVKLVVVEPQTAALRRYLAAYPSRASSMLLRTEAVRAVRRLDAARVARARVQLSRLHLIIADEALLDRAADLEPAGLRSLDAIHLAAALTLGPRLGVVVTYDARMAEGAGQLGLTVASPA